MSKVWQESLDEQDFMKVWLHSEDWFVYFVQLPREEPVPRWKRFPEVTIEIEAGRTPHDFIQAETLFAVSDRLKAVFEEFGARAEFFPVRVVQDGREYVERAYYFCHIFDLVECLDLERGEYTFRDWPGRTDHVEMITKLAIDEDKAAGHDLFRIAKMLDTIICVSDRVAGAIRERGLTGMQLLDPAETN